MQLILDSLVLVIGVLMLLGGIHFKKMNRKNKSWPKVKGHLKLLEIAESSTKRGSSKASYILKGAYSYEVSGKEYTSDRIHSIDSRLGAESTIVYTQPEAERKREELKVSALEVTYNPRFPEEAYLLPASGRWSHLAIVGGVLTLLIGVGRFMV